MIWLMQLWFYYSFASNMSDDVLNFNDTDGENWLRYFYSKSNWNKMSNLIKGKAYEKIEYIFFKAYPMIHYYIYCV